MAAKRERAVKVPLPEGSLVAKAFDRNDYVDAYRIALPPQAPPTVDEVTRHLLTSRPKWVDGLMETRDLVVGLFGLKTSFPRDEDIPAVFTPGAKLGLFEVFERTPTEVLLGANDAHLDFRASVLVGNDESGRFVVMSTVVRYNNALGRTYFAGVKPFHKKIVRTMLEHAVNEFQS